MLRVSDTFREGWEKFLKQSIDQSAYPAFYQFISHQLFLEFVKGKHVIATSVDDYVSPLTKEEENALRYVAGFVCRKVQEKIKASSLPNKEDMLLFISDMSGDEWDEEKGTEVWTNGIDRGGLWHINDNVYTMFYLIEENIRKHLKVQSAKKLNMDTKDTILDDIYTNEDILFQWSLLSASVDENVGMIILQKIANLYVTIRGFAFASSCLELYKQQYKKKTQKSKSLRKKLCTN